MPLQRYLLQNPILSNFPVSPVTVVIDATDNALYALRIEFSGDEAMWTHIKQDKLFGYSDEACGPIMGGHFLTDRPLMFTINLSYESLQLLSILAEDPHQAHTLIANAEPDSPLRDTRSYQLLSVMQQRTPKTQWGLTTTYFAAQLR